METRYFEDFAVGETFESTGVTVTEDAIIDFALRYDPQPFHVDAVAAKDTVYGGLIASGFQTLALTFRLFLGIGVVADSSLGGARMDELRWPKPVRPGDTLRVVVEVVEKRPSRRNADRGTVRMRFTTVNQHGEVVLSVVGDQLVRKSSAAE